jgi:YD repeat-containing protein
VLPSRSHGSRPGALTNESVTNTAVSSTPYDSTSYAYDPFGNITAETDVRNGTEEETQCFDYDLLESAHAGVDDRQLVGLLVFGRPVGRLRRLSGRRHPRREYWTSWTYNALGDQTSQAQHALTSGGTNTVTTYTDNDGNGTSSGQPDTLTSAATTGPSGNSTATYTDNADGDTTARDLSGGDQSLIWFRTGSGTSYDFEVTDQHGTSLLALNDECESPYLAAGNPVRGTRPSQRYASTTTTTSATFTPGHGTVPTSSNNRWAPAATPCCARHGARSVPLARDCRPDPAAWSADAGRRRPQPGAGQVSAARPRPSRTRRSCRGPT